MPPPLDDRAGEPIVSFRGVVKRFGERTVLDGIDFDLMRGETSVVLGPSGTGKSVCLKLMVGLMRPTEGSVHVAGVDVAHAPEPELFALRRRVGMMFQDGALFDSLTVGENIAFPLRRHTRLAEAEVRDQVAHRLEQVGLPGIEDRAPAALSGGMRKRVSLARAIVLDPEIVLFDEPNSGLDPVTSDEIDTLIEETKAELGLTFVVISHDIVSAFRIGDHLAMLHGGKVVAQGSPEQVRQSHDPFVRRFLARNLTLPPLPESA